MTVLNKDYRNNWRAEDQVDLGNNKLLSITTVKTHSGAIVTRASVHTKESGGLAHMVFQDFSQCLKTTKNRCTEKNVAAQHDEAMTKLPEIKEAVTAWYAKEAAEQNS